MSRRNDLISELIKLAPLVFEVTLSADMGYEISAITHEGVIFAAPGMLVEYSELQLSKMLSGRELGRFLDSLEVTPYCELSLEDLLVLKEEVSS
jgi:hypothetical protein